MTRKFENFVGKLGCGSAQLNSFIFIIILFFNKQTHSFIYRNKNIFQIKMVGSIGASHVCENLLNNVKSSNLNYLVNETPYSAYITIRKMFIKNYIQVKDPVESNNATLAQEVHSNDNEIECDRLKSELKLVKKELHDAKSNLEGYEKENVSLNQNLFILKVN